MKHSKLLTIAAATVLTLVISDSAWSMGIRPPRESRTPATTATPKPTPKPSATPATPPAQSAAFTPLWVGKHPDAVNWGGYVDEALERYGHALLNGPGDVEDFCPMYNRLGHRDQQNFWIQLLAAMTKFESGFNPMSRYVETTMSIDPVTGKQVVSEGLLQLSYQDERSYGSALPQGVCDFDWTHDKVLAINDIHRTIFDPKTNLTCGIWILDHQVQLKGKIAIASGAYWAVIKTNSKYSKLGEIQQITRALPFCK